MAIPGNVFRYSSSMEAAVTNSSGIIKLSVPATGAGNCGVMFLQTGGASTTPTVTDDKGNTWALVSGFPISGNQKLWVYVATNMTAGTSLITLTFATADSFSAIDYSEWYNVSTAALATALSGTPTSATAQTSPVSAGSITPAAGDLVIQYVTGDSSTLNTSFTKGTGFTLLSANTMNGAALVTTAIQWRLAPGGAINPTMSTVGGSPSCDTIAIGLKAAAAGTPPPSGIRVAGVQKSSFGPPTGPTGAISLVFQFPHVGNLMVMTSTHDFSISSILDSDSNTWDITHNFPAPGGGSQTQTSFAKNVTPNGDMTGPTITWSSAMLGVNLGFVTIYDIVGADANPFTSQYITNNGTQSVNANLDIFSGAKQLVTTTAGNLWIFDSLITSNTVSGLVAPTPANGGSAVLFDFPDAAGGGTTAEDDDFHGYWYNATTAPQTITLSIQNNTGGVGNWTATAMEFKPAATGPVINAAIARSSLGFSTGKRHVTTVFNTAASLPNVGIGVDDGRQILTSNGGQAGGICWTGDGNVAYNGTSAVYTAATFTAGDNTDMEVDFDAKLIWFRVNGGNWNNSALASPATGTGGFSISAINYPMKMIVLLGATNDQATVNFGLTVFPNGLSNGFMAWVAANTIQSVSVPVSQPLITSLDTPTIGKKLTITSPETVSIQKQVGKNITSSHGETVSLSKQVGKGVTLSQGETLSLTKQAGKLIIFTQAQTLTLLKNTGKFITFTQVESLTLLKNVGKLITFSEAQSQSVRKNVGKNVSVTQAESLSVLKNVGKTLSFTQAQSLSLTKNIGKFISFTQAQTQSLIKNVGKFISFVLAETVSLVPTFISGGGGTNHPLSITINQSESLSLTKNVGKNETITQGQTVSINKAVGKNITQTQTNTFSLIAIKVRLQNMNITQTMTTTLTKSVGKLISITQVQSVSLTLQKSLSKLISITSAQTVSIIKAVGKNITATSSESFSLIALKARLVFITINQSQSVTLIKQVGKAISMAQAQAVTLIKNVGKKLSFSQAETTTLVAGKLSFKTINVTQNETASLSLKKVGSVNANISTASSLSLRKSVSKTLAMTSAMAISFTAFVRALFGKGKAQGSDIALFSATASDKAVFGATVSDKPMGNVTGLDS